MSNDIQPSSSKLLTQENISAVILAEWIPFRLR